MTNVSDERRAELLALAEPDEVQELAECCLSEGPEPSLVRNPEVGLVMLEVREPIEQIRFHLGEVLVARAEVEFQGFAGWCMRMDDDVRSALAGAICDAQAQAGGHLAAAVEELCTSVARRARDAVEREWRELAPTQVHFEELDRI